MPQISAPDLLLDVVLSPGLWLGAVLAFSYGLLVYGWRGGGLRQLGRYVLAGLAGFALGQIAGMMLEVGWLRLGQTQVLMGTMGSAVALSIVLFFNRRVSKNKQKPLYKNR